MVSQMVMEDIAALEARGARLTPEEIVRLNCLGLRVERGPRSAALFAPARIGWAGNVAIRQPTLGAERWCDTCAAQWFRGDEYDSALLWACAHGDIPGFFQRPEHREEASCRAVIAAWGARVLSVVTADQLKHALHVALFGDDPAADVVPEKSARAERLARERGEYAPPSDEDLANQALACGLGLSLADLEALTFSRVAGLIRLWRSNHDWDLSAAESRAFADYTVTLAAISKKYAALATAAAQPEE